MGQLPVVQQTRLLKTPPLLVSRLWHIRSSRGGNVTIESRSDRPDGLRSGSRRYQGWSASPARPRCLHPSVWAVGRRCGRPPRGGKSRLGPLADQAPFKLGQSAEHMKYEPPLRGRRVERFGQATKPDISRPAISDRFDQLLDRPRQPVKLPHKIVSPLRGNRSASCKAGDR